MTTAYEDRDAYSPREIAQRVQAVGVTKARMDGITLFALAVLAGAFIGLGGCFYTVVVTGSETGLGLTRMLGGLAFSLGLILVIVGGAELFTGNNLIAMAWASGLVTTREILRSWVIVYAGNVVGAVGTAALVAASGVQEIGAGAVGETVTAIAEHKTSLGALQALAAGVACNALVCLAVWIAMSGRSTTDRILAIVLPIAAFVACGFEHSIANWFFLPWAALTDSLDTAGAVRNLCVVTLGNVLGGTLLVAGVYWVAYLRSDRSNS